MCGFLGGWLLFSTAGSPQHVEGPCGWSSRCWGWCGPCLCGGKGLVAAAAVSPREEPQGVPSLGLQVNVFHVPPQEAGSGGWLDVVLAATGLAKSGISPVGTQGCWGRAAPPLCI